MSDNNDNWSSLLDDLGIEEPKTAAPEKPATAVPNDTVSDGTVSNSTVSEAAESEETEAKPAERKSIFSRFPKINLFGTPPKEPLETLVSGKTPARGGKPLTGNTIEKSQGIAPLREPQKALDETAGGRTAGNSGALPAIVSQIDAFAAGGNDHHNTGNHRSRRQSASIFEEPVPMSEEEKALQSIFDEPASQRSRRNAFNDDAFDENGGEPVRRERGRGSRKMPVVDDVTLDNEWQEVGAEEADIPPEPVQRREPNQRGGRQALPQERNGRQNAVPPRRYGNAVRHDIDESVPHNNAFDNNAFDAPADFDAPAPERQQRGRRGGYQKAALPIPPEQNYSERDYPERDYDDERPIERQTPRRERNDERSNNYRQPVQREYEADTLDDETEQRQIHRDIPGWEDAVGDIISGNIARHRNFSSGTGANASGAGSRRRR